MCARNNYCDRTIRSLLDHDPRQGHSDPVWAPLSRLLRTSERHVDWAEQKLDYALLRRTQAQLRRGRQEEDVIAARHRVALADQRLEDAQQAFTGVVLTIVDIRDQGYPIPEAALVVDAED